MKANKNTTRSEIKKVLSSVFNTDISQIDDNASQDTVENWDSIRHLNLIIALEEEFGIELTDEQSVEILSLPLIELILKEHGYTIENK